MSEQVTMQFGPLELRKTEEGWQYLSEGVGHEPDTWCDATYPSGQVIYPAPQSQDMVCT
uniref:hypothetical protein n=1 Tax=Pseudomonas putida TaxID=303 RepID=UPI0015955BA2|nr:hypothetical protein [Pseudomonas putida]